jgi:hypothetical protein
LADPLRSTARRLCGAFGLHCRGDNTGNQMGKYEKLLFLILRGTSDANIGFDDLRQLLLRLGFEERRRGSHHTFRKQGIEEKLNLQRDDSKAKAYQVRQVRTVILKYKLGGEL